MAEVARELGRFALSLKNWLIVDGNLWWVLGVLLIAGYLVNKLTAKTR